MLNLGMNYKHGLRKHPLYQRWVEMNRRCTAKHRKEYKNYGAKGITVCKKWDKEAGPMAFCAWADATHVEGMQLDRIDNSKGYSPDNCRWVTQADNTRNRTLGWKRKPKEA